MHSGRTINCVTAQEQGEHWHGIRPKLPDNAVPDAALVQRPGRAPRCVKNTGRVVLAALERGGVPPSLVKLGPWIWEARHTDDPIGRRSSVEGQASPIAVYRRRPRIGWSSEE
jgi:hypothetical protein